MRRRVRPTSLLDWGILAAYLVAMLLLVWSVVVVDWWSTATSLIAPEFVDGVPRATLTNDGQTLLSGYAGIALALMLIVPSGWFLSYRNRIAAVMLGLLGIGLTIASATLDPPVTALVTTNAWIPAVLAWFFYFGAVAVKAATLPPDADFEASAGS